MVKAGEELNLINSLGGFRLLFLGGVLELWGLGQKIIFTIFFFTGVGLGVPWGFMRKRGCLLGVPGMMCCARV